MTAGRPAASLPAGRPAASLPAGRPAATLPARHRAATTTARRPAATLVALALVLTGCAPAATTITSTGRVQTDTVSVQAPSLSVPKVNLNAGFAVTATTAANLSLVPTLLGFATPAMITLLTAAKLGAAVDEVKTQVNGNFDKVSNRNRELADQNRELTARIAALTGDPDSGAIPITVRNDL